MSHCECWWRTWMSELEQFKRLCIRDCITGKCTRIGFRSFRPAKEIEYRDRTSTFLSVSWRPHFSGASAGKVLFTFFIDIQDPLLLNSSSTEEPLQPMCTIRQSRAYAGTSKSKDWSCWREVWLFMIKHVHMFTGSHKWKDPSLSVSSLNVHLTARTSQPAISMCLVPWKTSYRAALSSDDELKDTVKNKVSLRSQKFWEHGILRLVNQNDRCTQTYCAHFA